MSKPSEKFDEHEAATAKRVYPAVVDGDTRPGATSKPELDDALRTTSGTRTAVTQGEIAQHLSGPRRQLVMPPELARGGEHADDIDRHARPTIDVLAGIPAVPFTTGESDWPPRDAATSMAEPMGASGVTSRARADDAPSSPVVIASVEPAVAARPDAASVSERSLSLSSSVSSSVSSSLSPSTSPASPTPIPRWLVPTVVASVLILVSAALSLGYLLGRVSGH